MAIVDIGTNSTRLLVADVVDAEVTEVERRSRVTRLGRGVDLSGQLSGEAVEAVCETVGDYARIWREAGAESVEAIATSAVRDSANGSAFIAELRERFALSARVLDGEEEARLTYLGATAGAPPSAPTLVVDIGGGSTEMIVGTGTEIVWHTSLQAGVVRYTERHLSADPPTTRELEALVADARASITGAVAETPGAEAERGVAVAGTPTSLAALALALEPYDPDRVHGFELELGAIQHQLSQLASASLEQRARMAGLHPDRAPTIVAGVVLLIEVMRAFGLDRITVSEHDILYGSAISAASRCG